MSEASIPYQVQAIQFLIDDFPNRQVGASSIQEIFSALLELIVTVNEERSTTLDFDWR